MLVIDIVGERQLQTESKGRFEPPPSLQDTPQGKLQAL